MTEFEAIVRAMFDIPASDKIESFNPTALDRNQYVFAHCCNPDHRLIDVVLLDVEYRQVVLQKHRFATGARNIVNVFIGRCPNCNKTFLQRGQVEFHYKTSAPLKPN